MSRISPAGTSGSLLSRHHAEHGGEIVECDQPVGVNDIPERKDETSDDRRPNELTPEPRDHGRAGVGAVGHRPAFLLAAHAPGQHGEQHRPPDNEIDRNCGRQRHQFVTRAGRRQRIKVKNKSKSRIRIVKRAAMLLPQHALWRKTHVLERHDLAPLQLQPLCGSAPRWYRFGPRLRLRRRAGGRRWLRLLWLLRGGSRRRPALLLSILLLLRMRDLSLLRQLLPGLHLPFGLLRHPDRIWLWHRVWLW